MTQKEIAIAYNVCEDTISCIKCGRTYSDVFVEGFIPNNINKNNKINLDMARKIKELLNTTDYSYKQISDYLGINSPSIVGKIKRGEIWKDI